MYTIHANDKTCIVSLHAATRMRQRNISEAMRIEALEQSDLIEQPNNRDRYEYHRWDEDTECIVQIMVVIAEDILEIVTVMLEENN